MKQHNIRSMRRPEVVDAIGAIDQQIAELQAERERLVKQFQTKEGSYLGEDFRLSAYYWNSAVLDFKKVRKLLGEQVYRKCFTRKQVHVVRVLSINSKEA